MISLFYYQDPWCAGLSTYYFNLVRSLADLGHRVFLVVPEDGRPANAMPNCEVSTIRAGNLIAEEGKPDLGGLARAARRLLFSFRVLLKVRQLARRAHLDLILAPELFAPGLLVAFFMRDKLITRIHAPSYIGDEYNQRYPFRWMPHLPSFVEKIQAKRSAGLSAASTHLALVIQRDWHIPLERIRLIPNSVQVAWVRGLAATEPRELQSRYLLYFGRIERLKGVHILSRSLKAVLSERPGITMVFVGRDCGMKERILRENLPFRDRVVFLNTMEKGRLFSVIRHAELVVLPSLFENLSNAGLEAMALGRPVIGTYGTGFEEIIEDGANGFLVEPGNAEALAAKILSCLDRPDLEQIGRNAYESALRFDSRTVATQYVEFFRSTLARR